MLANFWTLRSTWVVGPSLVKSLITVVEGEAEADVEAEIVAIVEY